MAELKTKETQQSPSDFLKTIEKEELRKDCESIVSMMEELCGQPAKMWGNAIIGVGNCILIYPNGRTLDWFPMGFSPRKANIALYIQGCDAQEKSQLLDKLGKHSTGKGCVYIKKLSDINIDVLRQLCQLSLKS